MGAIRWIIFCMYSPPIEQLIKAFSRFPTIGRRSAERFVFYLLKSGKKDAAELTNALKQLIECVKSCQVCWDFSDQSPCAICANNSRDKRIICVVAESQDIQAMEQLREYTGRYHVLRGTLGKDMESTFDHLKIEELYHRVQEERPVEVLLALNSDMAGETTTLFLTQKLKAIDKTLLISRLARGLPMGSDLRYADEITLGSAFRNRTQK